MSERRSTVDLVVVGTGSAAQSVTSVCRQAGWSVTVVDYRPYGGTCAQRGCDPKKVLVWLSELADWSRRMQGKGITEPALSVAWPDLMRFKRTFTQPIPASTEQSFAASGIAMLHGVARFVDHTTIRVGDDVVTGRHLLIATGARHAPLNIPGEEYLTTSSGFLELDGLPPRVVFIGGGYIAMEFAHVAARTGAKVQILHRGTRPLAGFDADLVAQLVAATRALGVDIQVSTTVEAIERRGDALLVHVRRGEQEHAVATDLVVHAAGRVPEIDDLNLEMGGVAREKGGITVNNYLQSVSNLTVYAAGDAVASGGLPLTPVADLQGSIVAKNLLEGNRHTPDYRGIPSVVFTTPPLARVGLDEATARAQGLRFTTRQGDTAGWYSSRRVALAHSGFKVLIEERTDRLLGAHLLGLHADEVINLFALAIRARLPASALKEMVYAYPTSASDIPSMV